MATPIFDQDAAKKLKAAKGLAVQANTLTPVTQGATPQAAAQAAQQPKAQQAAAITGAVGQQAAAGLQQQGQAATQQSQLQLQQREAQNRQRLAETEIAQKAFLNDADIFQGLALNAEKRQAEERLTTEELSAAKRSQRLGLETDANLSFLTRTQREQLAALGADVKEKIFDSRLQFSKDEMGRKFSNERQLSDYVLANAKSEQELASRLQTQQLMQKRDLQIMEAAQAKVNEALRQAYGDKSRELTQQSKEYIANVQAAAERAMARKKARGAAMGQIITGAFTIGGAVAGFVATGGNPLGAAAGASVGSSTGQAVAGGTAK